jgi:flagellar hook-associated protein 1 FlgK
VEGLYDVYWVSNELTGALGDQFNLYNERIGGELRGLIEMRDGNNGENFRGTITEIGNDPNGGIDSAGNYLKYVTIEVDDEYLMDLNKTKLSNNGGKIILANTEFYYTDWTYNYDAQTGKTSYTFVIDESKNGEKMTPNMTFKEATIGAKVDYQGVPYYMQQMNEWVRTFSQKFNDILTSGYDSEGRVGAMMFTGKKAISDEQYDMPDAYRYDWATDRKQPITVKDNDDSYYLLTAKNFDILSAIEMDSSFLANRYDLTDGVEQNDLLEDLRNMA